MEVLEFCDVSTEVRVGGEPMRASCCLRLRRRMKAQSTPQISTAIGAALTPQAGHVKVKSKGSIKAKMGVPRTSRSVEPRSKASPLGPSRRRTETL
mmetsp:Transcript_45916/g.56335  ORF Transcript_45916/g.56335 Transcript_45916/m.56335 type:complete len:96 (-) Transcript_45916:821-1108(-)